MDIKTKIEMAKMRSLIERIERPRTFRQAMINEENHINEAKGNVRIVTRDEFLDILSNAANDNNAGQWFSMIYANAKGVYKTKKSWRYNDVADALGKSTDIDKDWHKQLTAFNDPAAKGKNPITGVVVVKSYQLHWKNPKVADADYARYAEKLHNIRMKYDEKSIPSNGMYGDNPNQRQDTGFGADLGQAGNLSKDFNMIGHKVNSTSVYLVDQEGNVGDEIPEAVFKAMSTPAPPAKPERQFVLNVADREDKDQLTKAYMEAKKELEDENIWKSCTFTLDKILGMKATVNGEKICFLNDNLISKLEKSEVHVDPVRMLEIGKEKLKELDADTVMQFSQP